MLRIKVPFLDYSEEVNVNLTNLSICNNSINYYILPFTTIAIAKQI